MGPYAAPPMTVRACFGILVATLVQGIPVALRRRSFKYSSGSDRAVLAGVFGAMVADSPSREGSRRGWRESVADDLAARSSTEGPEVVHARKRWMGPSVDRPGVTTMLVDSSRSRCRVCQPRRVYGFAYSHLVWDGTPLQEAGTLCAGVLPLGLLGMAGSCVHHMFDRRVGTTGDRLHSAGVRTGLLNISIFRGPRTTQRPPVLVGALRAFLASLDSVLIAGARRRPRPRVHDRPIAAMERSPSAVVEGQRVDLGTFRAVAR